MDILFLNVTLTKTQDRLCKGKKCRKIPEIPLECAACHSESVDLILENISDVLSCIVKVGLVMSVKIARFCNTVQQTFDKPNDSPATRIAVNIVHYKRVL